MRPITQTSHRRALASNSSTWAVAACGLLLSAAVWAQTAVPTQGGKDAAADARAGEQTLYLKALAATCANCHGTDGRSAEGASMASLAGLDKAYISKQMKDFKSGVRPATVMHQLSKGYSDAQIDALAGYFAAQPK